MAGKPKKVTVQWRLVRKASQWIFLLAFLVLFILTAGLALPSDVLNLPVRLSPLLIISQSLASRVVLTGSWIGIITLLLTILFGRAWCGWICPVGTILDLFPFKDRHSKRTQNTPETWRMGKYLILVVILFAALAGNLSLMLLDPITLWIRALTGSVWPALNAGFTSIEYSLAQIPLLTNSIVWSDQLLRPVIFPDVVLGTRLTWLPLAIFTVIILLNIIAERFWCRYLCPLGGLLGIISKVAIFHRVVSSECKNCGLCSRDCPTGTIDPKLEYRSDPAECIVCLDCLDSCKSSGNSFQWIKPEVAHRLYDPSRRAFISAGLVGLGGAAVIQADKAGGSASPFLIRPPGVIEDEFLAKCLRCGLCMRACPTGIIQPAVSESGIAGLFTPVLVPELGYCQFSCTKCGEICPVEAIPQLSLEDKQQTVIGKAYINRNRCIPWAEGNDCIVCEEMCPLPGKAIILEDKQVVRPDGEILDLKLPVVIAELCIGCGICEYKCPQAGEAAIRVYRPDDQGLF